MVGNRRQRREEGVEREERRLGNGTKAREQEGIGRRGEDGALPFIGTSLQNHRFITVVDYLATM